MNTSVGIGRIQIIQGTPPALPGKCAVCGTTQGPVIDFGFSLDFYGAVYFCFQCMTEIANALDYHSPRQHRMLLNELEELKKENNSLKDENEVINNALDSYHRVSRIPRRPSPHSVSLDATVSYLTGESTESNNPEPAGGEERSSEQTDEQRPSDIQRDDSLDEFLNSI